MAGTHPKSEAVFVGLDWRGHRHLLVGVSSERPCGRVLQTKGLNAEVADLALDGREVERWLDVVCSDSARDDVFAIVAADVADAVRAAPTDPFEAVRETLERWHRFWTGLSTSWSLEREVGLFGELWFLHRWLGAENVSCWKGPSGNRHDFVGRSVSVEVKTSLSSDGSLRHLIGSLDQLADPEVGDLYFFSLQVTQDAASANSVGLLVDRLLEALNQKTLGRELLEDALSSHGWAPGVTERTFRVLNEGLYVVAPGFPRLTPLGLQEVMPAGIEGVSYLLDLAVCPELIVASAPLAGAKVLREGM